MDQVVEPAAHREWQDQLAAVEAELGPGWESQYGPGSFGCHELLDRVHLLGDLVEGQVSAHPTCALHAEWYQLASRAAEALRELYRVVGEAHLAEREAPAPGAAPDRPRDLALSASTPRPA